MRSFECLITDDRFSVRQLTWIVVGSEERAHELAREELRRNKHCAAVELRENGRLLATMIRHEAGA
ncbi:hypothetical protein [Phenylobacterium sp.]|jgi:hypothetical protein|uniref:hypothetical protein n=1 Tax=Phenylobacterium sp. TaxID=1871053 RepID=UPI002F9275D9